MYIANQQETLACPLGGAEIFQVKQTFGSYGAGIVTEPGSYKHVAARRPGTKQQRIPPLVLRERLRRVALRGKPRGNEGTG